MMSRQANLPFLLTTMSLVRCPKYERLNADFSNRIEKILKDPCQPWTSELDRGLRIDLEKFDLELGGWGIERRRRRYVRDEKVDSVELKCVWERLKKWLLGRR